jgi:hypothetical protein
LPTENRADSLEAAIEPDLSRGLEFVEHALLSQNREALAKKAATVVLEALSSPGAKRKSASAWRPGKVPSHSEAILIGDVSMPYRLMTSAASCRSARYATSTTSSTPCVP